MRCTRVQFISNFNVCIEKKMIIAFASTLQSETIALLLLQRGYIFQDAVNTFDIDEEIDPYIPITDFPVEDRKKRDTYISGLIVFSLIFYFCRTISKCCFCIDYNVLVYRNDIQL